MADNSEALLRAILAICGRQTFSPERLTEIVSPGGAKHVQAFNLCDGSKGQGEIGKALKLDSGNFSRTVSRWIEEGVVVRLGEGREAKLLHVYPLPRRVKAKKKGTKKK